MEDKPDRERRLTLRLPGTVLEVLQMLSKHHGRSLNAEILWALKSYIWEDSLVKTEGRIEESRQIAQSILKNTEQQHEVVKQIRAAVAEYQALVKADSPPVDEETPNE